MSRKGRVFAAGFCVIAIAAAGLLVLMRQRPVSASELSADISRGQVAANAADIVRESSNTSLRGPVVLRLNTPRRVNRLDEVQAGDLLIVGEDVRLVGQARLAALWAHEHGQPSDHYVLPIPIKVYRRRIDGRFDHLDQDNISTIRLTTNVPWLEGASK